MEIDGIGLRTWLEIDTQAIAYNYALFRQLIPARTQLMSVVKSNAYGHGLIDFSHAIVACGVDWLGVDSFVEAQALRYEGISIPILVLGFTLPQNFERAAALNISLTLSSLDHLRWAVAQAAPVLCHLEIETGMHRQGIFLDEVPEALELLRLHPHITLQGLYTHFAAAKDPKNLQHTREQVAVFEKARALVHEAGYQPIVHAAASGGTLVYPETHYDLVRVGMALHGHWPSEETRIAYTHERTLHPTLTWKSTVSEVKTARATGGVGYDLTDKIYAGDILAVIPLGYWHGYPRGLSSVGEVLIRGQRARVKGRISMDMIVVEVTAIPGVSVGDEVVLIGRQSDAYVSVQELAGLANTSDYEFLTRLNPLIKRVYT